MQVYEDLDPQSCEGRQHVGGQSRNIGVHVLLGVGITLVVRSPLLLDDPDGVDLAGRDEVGRELGARVQVEHLRQHKEEVSASSGTTRERRRTK